MTATGEESASVARVAAALAAAGARGRIRILADSARTARAAAEALGVQIGQITNSLVFEAAGQPLLVLASGIARVDTLVIADLLGVDEVRQATPQFVRTHTGFAIGGVAPVGHLEPLRTLVDVQLAAYPVVWAAAGHPHAVFDTTYDELLRLTGGSAAQVR
jgi:prolyl-tRNA editing enzyme YbaK/EbsC (Cys-tRNA(Pro) deacylase)